MRQIGSSVFWVCAGLALFMVLAGLWNAAEGRPGSILDFCFGSAALFLAAGAVVAAAGRRAEQKARDA
jgi:hypothetical protein